MANLWRQARDETSLPDGIDSTCTIGCLPDLWPGLGRVAFDRLRADEPTVAVSARQAGHDELTRLLSAGQIDLAFTHDAVIQGNQIVHTLAPDRLVLVSNRPDTPMRHDPGYCYVDSGPDFRRRHDEYYADADTATVSFDSAVWARAHLLSHGGSAYLPFRLVADDLAAGSLFTVANAPEFERAIYLIATTEADPGRVAQLGTGDA